MENAERTVGLIYDSCGGAIGGQTTKNSEIMRYFSRKNISLDICDTYGMGRKRFFSLWRKIKRICKYNQKIIVIQGWSAKPYMWPVLWHMHCIYHNDFYELMIGGNESQYLPKYPWVMHAYKGFKRVYAETFLLTEGLQQIGICCATRLPNFISIKPHKREAVVFDFNRPLPVCTFSRICKKKGIEIAMKAVRMINQKYGRAIYHLNIFGPVEQEYEDEFAVLQKEFKQEASYGGYVNEENKDKLHEHYMLLFPTEHEAEGFPAALIDAFSEGLPVICSDVSDLPKLVEHGRLGFVAQKPYVEQIASYLEEAYQMPEKIFAMRKEALHESQKYDADIVLKQLWNDIWD